MECILLLPVLTKIVKLLTTTLIVASKVRTTFVFTLIKKIMLYREGSTNFHPVSYLLYIGKVTAKVVVKQIISNMTTNKLHPVSLS